MGGKALEWFADAQTSKAWSLTHIYSKTLIVFFGHFIGELTLDCNQSPSDADMIATILVYVAFKSVPIEEQVMPSNMFEPCVWVSDALNHVSRKKLDHE